jgi:hypothetical protein
MGAKVSSIGTRNRIRGALLFQDMAVPNMVKNRKLSKAINRARRQSAACSAGLHDALPRAPWWCGARVSVEHPVRSAGNCPHPQVCRRAGGPVSGSRHPAMAGRSTPPRIKSAADLAVSDCGGDVGRGSVRVGELQRGVEPDRLGRTGLGNGGPPSWPPPAVTGSGSPILAASNRGLADLSCSSLRRVQGGSRGLGFTKPLVNTMLGAAREGEL